MRTRRQSPMCAARRLPFPTVPARSRRRHGGSEAACSPELPVWPTGATRNTHASASAPVCSFGRAHARASGGAPLHGGHLALACRTFSASASSQGRCHTWSRRSGCVPPLFALELAIAAAAATALPCDGPNRSRGCLAASLTPPSFIPTIPAEAALSRGWPRPPHSRGARALCASRAGGVA